MRVAVFVVAWMMLATLACTLTGEDSDEETSGGTPTAIRISDAQATATFESGVGERPSVENEFPEAPPTALPTLEATPLQFAPSSSNGNTTSNSGGGGGASSSSQVGLSNAAAGAPSSGSFYFPDTIVYSSNGQVFSVSTSGGNAQSIAGGQRPTRSLNGLYVVPSGTNVTRPDGRNVTFSNTGATTAPSFSPSGTNVAYAVGANIVRWSGGSSTTLTTMTSPAGVVQYAPDGNGILYGNDAQAGVVFDSGSHIDMISTPDNPIVRGPYWATRGTRWGVYVQLASGQRFWFNRDTGERQEITDDFERLHLASPTDNDVRRLIVMADNGGSMTLRTQWPDFPQRDFDTLSLDDVSWSPSSPQLVYVNTNGELIFLDIPSGEQRVIAGGGVRYPVWSVARYVVGR